MKQTIDPDGLVFLTASLFHLTFYNSTKRIFIEPNFVHNVQPPPYLDLKQSLSKEKMASPGMDQFVLRMSDFLIWFPTRLDSAIF